MLAKLEKRAQMLFEHKPKELRLAVNGNFQGTLKVTSDLNEIDLLVANKKPLEFIEIYSEQQMRLLFINVESSVPLPTRDSTHTLTLSDGRKLDLNFAFAADGAEINLRYQDPTFKEVQALLENPKMLDDTYIPPISITPQTTVSPTFLNRLSELFSNLTNLFSFSWRRFAFVGLLAIIAVGGFILLDRQSTLSADAILKESEIKKMNWQHQKGKIVHWVDEEIVIQDGKRERILSYRWSNNLNAQREDLILKYNEQNQLFWGRWIKADGSLIVFNDRGQKSIRVDPGISQIKQSLSSLNDVDKRVMERYLMAAEKTISSEKLIKSNADWLIKNYQNKTASTCEFNGKKALCVILKMEDKQNSASSQVETYYDTETMERLFFKVTNIEKDGRTRIEEARTISMSESTLEEFENNEITRHLALGQNVKFVSVEEFARRIAPFYPDKK